MSDEQLSGKLSYHQVEAKRLMDENEVRKNEVRKNAATKTEDGK